MNRLSCSSYSALLIISKYRAEQGPIVFPILLAHILCIFNVAHMSLSAEARLRLRRAVYMQSHGLRRKNLKRSAKVRSSNPFSVFIHTP